MKKYIRPRNHGSANSPHRLYAGIALGLMAAILRPILYQGGAWFAPFSGPSISRHFSCSGGTSSSPEARRPGCRSGSSMHFAYWADRRPESWRESCFTIRPSNQDYCERRGSLSSCRSSCCRWAIIFIAAASSARFSRSLHVRLLGNKWRNSLNKRPPHTAETPNVRHWTI